MKMAINVTPGHKNGVIAAIICKFLSEAKVMWPMVNEHFSKTRAFEAGKAVS